ncbi:MAG: glycine--tRNA ligase [Puniceicoccales bacterium]|jgi:glycyl-tRNA synthetase|nr:glycine--tRNA ligase [Puniceicoccales bacterium]
MSDAAQATMDQITALCRRRGFIFQSSEIYGGLAGFFDYGPLGSEMKKNIRDAWWNDMVRRKDNMVGVDCSIITNSLVWKASGHVEGFSDPMVDCKESKMRYRADQLYFSKISVDGEFIGYVSVLEDNNMQSVAEKFANDLKKRLGKDGKLDKITLNNYIKARPDEYELIPSPATGKPGSLTPPRAFNLMFTTHIGALTDDSSMAYLRPETAQSIFINFKNVLDTSRLKVPFGIAQIGKAFRNEITPRNFTFRSREFEQMELEFFIQEDIWEAWHSYWVDERLTWHKNIGLDPSLLSLEVHSKEKLAHYSRACTDIIFKYPFGWSELEGIAARGNFDLTKHHNASGKSLEFFDESKNCSYIPHVIEPSVGVDRLFLALLCSAYAEDEIDGERRVILRLHPRIAPIKIAILPLVKNRSEIVIMARKLYDRFSKICNAFYDESGAIGRRYRRMDEIGTPYCLTVDFESLETQTFTLRDRDSTTQVRLTEEQVVARLMENIF